MGRTNGKLIPFLRNGLEDDLYPNLKYESNSKDVFHIYFPRFEHERSIAIDGCECILKKWYEINERGNQYISNSRAKGVFQASLKKSVYLMWEPTPSIRLRFRFANATEIKENKERERGKQNKKSAVFNSCNDLRSGLLDDSTSNFENLLPMFDFFENNPLSVQSSSSGYISGEDMEEKNDAIPLRENDNMNLNLDFFDEMCINGKEDIDLDLEGIEIEDLFKPLNQPQNSKVEELCYTTVDVSKFLNQKTYWLCNKKLNLDPILLLICEKQVIEMENQIAEGSTIIIPNEVWEPGISYESRTIFELDGRLYLFLSPRV